MDIDSHQSCHCHFKIEALGFNVINQNILMSVLINFYSCDEIS